jgi:hypothetical protein
MVISEETWVKGVSCNRRLARQFFFHHRNDFLACCCDNQITELLPTLPQLVQQFPLGFDPEEEYKSAGNPEEYRHSGIHAVIHYDAEKTIQIRLGRALR